MERWLIEKQSGSSVYSNVQNSLPELLTQRKKRLTRCFSSWADNVIMLRKYRRIFMNRIIRIQRLRLQSCFGWWVEFYDAAREQKWVESGAIVPLQTRGLSERERQAAQEAVWAEKAKEKEQVKRLHIMERDAAKKRQASRDKQAEIAALRAAAVSKQDELTRLRDIEDERRRDDLAEQLVALEKERQREIGERKRREAIEAAELVKAAEEQAKLDRASDMTLALFSNQRAVSKAKAAQDAPQEVEDYMSLMKKSMKDEGQAEPGADDSEAEVPSEVENA